MVDGRPLPDAPAARPDAPPRWWPTPGAGGRDRRGRGPSDAGRDLRYEVMYFLEAPDDTIPAFKEVWAGIGDSIVVVGGDGLWNCHIHTDDVGASIEAALDAGRPRDIRVTDLVEQIEEERWVREAVAPDAGRRRPPALRPAPPWWRWPTARAWAGSSAPSGCTTSWPAASR